MHRSSKKIPLLVTRPLPGARQRATEPWRPRPTDLCADRIDALATCVALRGPLVLRDGRTVDADTLQTIAHQQRLRESDLQETFGRTRTLYEDYHSATRDVRALLLAGIEQLERGIDRTDSIARTALRTAKLRRPPKATIARLRAIVAKRRSEGEK